MKYPLILRTKSGFTLLEVVIAITIFGICISLVYTLYNSVTSIVSSVEFEAKRATAVEITFNRISDDLKSLYIGQQGFLIGQQPGGFNGDDPFLSFTSTAHLRLEQKTPPVDVSLIRYYLKEHENKNTYRLLRSDTPIWGNIDNNSFPEQQKHLLSESLVKLEIVFVDVDGEEYSEWHSVEEFEQEDEASVRFPLGFKMIMALGDDRDDEDNATHYQMSISISKNLIEFEEEP